MRSHPSATIRADFGLAALALASRCLGLVVFAALLVAGLWWHRRTG